MGVSFPLRETFTVGDFSERNYEICSEVSDIEMSAYQTPILIFKFPASRIGSFQASSRNSFLISRNSVVAGSNFSG